MAFIQKGHLPVKEVPRNTDSIFEGSVMQTVLQEADLCSCFLQV